MTNLALSVDGSRSSSNTSEMTLPVPAHLIDENLNSEKVFGDIESGSSKSFETSPPPPPVSLSQKLVELDWNAIDDPANPQNWSNLKKVYHIALIGLQCFVVTFGSSVFAPSIVHIAQYFRVSIEAATVPLTVYVLGLAFGPMISAPLCEVFGRRLTYMSVFPVSLLFTLGAGLSKSFGTLIFCRLMAGTIGSGALAIGGVSIGEIIKPMNRASVATIFISMPFLGPAIGPAVGGAVAQYKDWRWSQWTVLMVGTFTALFGLFQSETYKKIILTKRAKKNNQPIPPTPMDNLTAVQRLGFILELTVTRPLKMLVTDPIVGLFAVYTAFNFGVLFAFFAAFPLIFQSPYRQIQVYHFTASQTGLTYLALAIGIIFACGMFIADDRFYYKPRALAALRKGANSSRSSILPPENRIHAAMIGSLFLPLSLFWMAWTAKKEFHWLVPVSSCIFFGAGNVLVFFTAVMYQLDAYPPMMAASTMSANGILRYIAGACFPLFARQMYLRLGVAWAMSLLGFVTVALLPFPWLLYYYGPRLRSASRYIN